MNPNFTPLEKLSKLQTLSVMEFFEKHNKDFLFKGKNMVLTQDENIFIMAFIIIHAKIPDMTS